MQWSSHWSPPPFLWTVMQLNSRPLNLSVALAPTLSFLSPLHHYGPFPFFLSLYFAMIPNTTSYARALQQLSPRRIL